MLDHYPYSAATTKEVNVNPLSGDAMPVGFGSRLG
jgi:hypothetical protein